MKSRSRFTPHESGPGTPVLPHPEHFLLHADREDGVADVWPQFLRALCHVVVGQHEEAS